MRRERKNSRTGGRTANGELAHADRIHGGALSSDTKI